MKAFRAEMAGDRSEIPGLTDGSPVRVAGRRVMRRRLLAVTLVTCITVVSAATARLFIWPDRGMPTYVSAIVMLNGPGDRLHQFPETVIEIG